MGDMGMAKKKRTGAAAPFIVADVGQAKASLAEMSIALATALGGVNVNARTGAGAPKNQFRSWSFMVQSGTRLGRSGSRRSAGFQAT